MRVVIEKMVRVQLIGVAMGVAWRRFVVPASKPMVDGAALPHSRVVAQSFMFLGLVASRPLGHASAILLPIMSWLAFQAAWSSGSSVSLCWG